MSRKITDRIAADLNHRLLPPEQTVPFEPVTEAVEVRIFQNEDESKAIRSH